MKQPDAIVKTFLLYAPGFPFIPNPQQHISAPDPPAPHISIVAVPADGATQHT
jgi:hypothetical protein